MDSQRSTGSDSKKPTSKSRVASGLFMQPSVEKRAEVVKKPSKIEEQEEEESNIHPEVKRKEKFA